MSKRKKTESVGLDCSECKYAETCYGQECFKEREKERRAKRFVRYRGIELDDIDDDSED